MLHLARGKRSMPKPLRLPLQSDIYFPRITSVAKNFPRVGYSSQVLGVNLSFYSSYTAAAAAKSLQSCPTLCNPRNGSPPGSPVPGILQARTLEWGAIAFSQLLRCTFPKGCHIWCLKSGMTLHTFIFMHKSAIHRLISLFCGLPPHSGRHGALVESLCCVAHSQ